MTRETTSEAFFDSKYQQDADPWRFSTDSYEQQRYSATIASLNGRFFQRTFEPGCSIGVLTERLAMLSGQVEAIEISATAVAEAQRRCRHLANVKIRHRSLPEGLPDDDYDLLVFSEIGYYFSRPELASLAGRLVSRLKAGGLLLAVHWLGHSPDHELSGDEVHEVLSEVPGLQHLLSRRHSLFRLDQWVRS